MQFVGLNLTVVKGLSINMHLYEFSQVLNDSINGVELTKSCQDVFCALVDCSITYYLWKRSDDKGVAISLKKTPTKMLLIVIFFYTNKLQMCSTLSSYNLCSPRKGDCRCIPRLLARFSGSHKVFNASGCIREQSTKDIIIYMYQEHLLSYIHVPTLCIYCWLYYFRGD